MCIGFSNYSFRLFAQTKAQAESVLGSMTPEEIDKKLKELGMSREEAVARAGAIDIDLEEFLRKAQPSTPAKDTVKQANQNPESMSPARTKSQQEFSKAAKDSVVPGFEGRPQAVHLQPFGYNIFQYPRSTFEPVLNVATPPSYALGPGDEVIISVWGDTKLYYQLSVNREGNILVPDVGPIGANGMSIQQLKGKMLKRMTAVYSSLRNGEKGATSFFDLSLGKLRTIQIFVLGEVQKPGGYALSSMSTAIHALYLSGGPTINGSLRSIQIVRNGSVFGTLDFYDYALRADNSKDIRLQDGDIVFVKPVGIRAGVAGFVLRPGMYEMKEKENLSTLLEFAGGLRFDAYFQRLHVERLVPFDEQKNYAKNFLDFDLHFATYEEVVKSTFEIQSGDIVSVSQVGLLPENRVTISGNVQKPGVFQLNPGMHVKDLLLEADSLARNTFSERGTLFRLLPNLRREVIAFNPRLALFGEEQNNIELKNEDSLIIYKESQFFPEHTVSIGGAVRNPGKYPRHDSMTVADLVVMAGGLTEGASTVEWELSRLDTTHFGTLSTIKKFNVQNDYWNENNGEASFLQDFDYLMIPSNPKYNLQKFVGIFGYVYYPGGYALRVEDERLSSLVKRAGGLRPDAYLAGSTLFRKWNHAGLVPIDFEKALEDTESSENLRLLQGDSIMISYQQEVVMVRGEVFVPAAIVHKKGASLSYYLEQAGGLKDGADEGRTVVMLPNGRKWEPGWFIFPNPDIQGGSTIFVPKKIEVKTETLAILRDWATIMASIAAISIGIIQITK
jgi:polysaccharide biosynthesis/export protein